MTRYARAEGSKASNEKLPNEATPWHLMKQQIEESKSKKPLENKKLVKKLTDRKDGDNIRNNNYNWADFDSDKSENLKSKHCNKFTKNSKSSDTDNVKIENNAKQLESTEDRRDEKTDSKKNKCSNKKIQYNYTHSESNNKESCTSQSNKSLNLAVLSKRQKRNLKRKLRREKMDKFGDDKSKKFKKDESKDNSQSKVKEKRIKQDGEYRRKKPNTSIQTITINGMEIKIVKYNGFPIKKEDAERLTKLKQDLLLKGIPQSEVDITLKLERRKAEKSLARVRKLLCFNCRKSGHILSDCPELGGQEEAGTGICFKCGSTEHTHFECKVSKDSAYRYAKCFICHEQGHISSQCPDNPKGVYPNGGCCKICGDVTHLKKDCPNLMKTKEENTITLEKIDDSAVESL